MGQGNSLWPGGGGLGNGKLLLGQIVDVFFVGRLGCPAPANNTLATPVGLPST